MSPKHDKIITDDQETPLTKPGEDQMPEARIRGGNAGHVDAVLGITRAHLALEKARDKFAELETELLRLDKATEQLATELKRLRAAWDGPPVIVNGTVVAMSNGDEVEIGDETITVDIP